MQIPGRTPANTAMTAATLDLMSGGRFILGLGTSGPQVVEGWHGQPWGKPLGKTREYVEIVRAALRRELVEHDGEQYRIPYDGPGATGLGKPLKLMLRPLRSDIPIYLAAIGPKNVALAAEIADGWLPIFVDPARFDAAFGASLAGARPGFEIAATVSVLVGDDVDALRDTLKPYLALYIGGMGSKGKNFYNALVRRYGWEEDAERIQDLYLGGKQREAIAAVPDALVDAVALVGPKDRIRERLEAWKETPVTTLIVGSPQPEALQVMAELLL
jgi:F420-dependent oxidoreductase-like protein